MVGGPVVNKNELPQKVRIALGQVRPALVQNGEIFFFVVQRGDNRNLRRQLDQTPRGVEIGEYENGGCTDIR